MKWLVTFVLLSLSVAAYAAENKTRKISASGGGIVKPGSDLVLTLDVAEVWDRCYWFWYEHKHDVSYCSFDLDADTGKAEKHKCEPEDLSHMEYSGTDKSACQITVSNVSDDDNCTWAARLDYDLEATPISIIVGKDVTGGKITVGGDAGYLEAGKVGPVVCTMNGGRPAPSLTMTISDFSKAQIVNDSQTQTPDADGVYTSVQLFNIQPKPEDNGKGISCKAAIFDGEGKPLFKEMAEAKEGVTTLNVKFPPQPMADQTVKVVQGKDADVSFVFMSNPAPTDIKWKVLTTSGNSTKGDKKKEKEREDATADKAVSVKPGQDDDKYKASELIDEKNGKYRLNLTIKAVTMGDGDKAYSLKAGNEFGSQEYAFKLEVEDHEEPGGNGTSSTTESPGGGGEDGEGGNTDGGTGEGGKGKSKTVAIVVVVLIVLIAIVIFGIVAYSRRSSRVDNTPLSNMERSSNR